MDFKQGRSGPTLKIDYTQYDFVIKPVQIWIEDVWNYEDEDFVYFDGVISEICYGN